MIVLLWVALIVALVVVLAACAWMLVRTFVRLLEAFAELIAKSAILDGAHRLDAEPRVFAVLEAPGATRARVVRHSTERRLRVLDRRRRRSDRAYALLHADVGPIAARLAGLDSIRRRLGGAYTKDDHHVE